MDPFWTKKNILKEENMFSKAIIPPREAISSWIAMRGVVLFLEGKKAEAGEAGKEKINVYI